MDVMRYAVALKGDPRRACSNDSVCPLVVVQASWRRFNRPVIESLVGDVDVVHGD